MPTIGATLLDVPGMESPRRLVNVNGKLFFSANDGVHGRELWISDGTLAGTKLVKDINEGPNSSAPSAGVNMNGLYFFTAVDGVNGRELWKSDGTPEGTQRVLNLAPGSRSAFPGNLTVVGNSLFFSAVGEVLDSRLYRTSGAVGDAVLLKDFGQQRATLLTRVGGTLFFSVDSGGGDASIPKDQLWKSNGDPNGTVRLKTFQGFSMRDMLGVGDTLFFNASKAGLGGVELWKSKGTSRSTDRVKNINPGGADSFPRDFGVFNNELVFSADDGVHGFEPWTSDGASAGTQLFLDINEAGDSNPRDFTQIGGQLFFTARPQDDAIGRLYVSDGNPFNTDVVNLNIGGSQAIDPFELTRISFNNPLFFTATHEDTGRELWKTDGTVAGTDFVDIRPGPGGSSPVQLTAATDKLFFSAFTGQSEQLFVVSVPPPFGFPPIGFGFPLIKDVTITSSISEGDTVTLTGRLEDPDPEDELFLDIDWGDNSPLETIQPNREPFTIQHRYLDDDPSNTSADDYVVFLTWRDSTGNGRSQSHVVTVHNVAPQVDVGGDATVRVNQLFKRVLTFSDPGADRWMITVDFGDGSPIQQLALKKDRQFVLKHHYRSPGEHQVAVTILDDDGGAGTGSFSVVVEENRRKRNHAKDSLADERARDAFFKLLAGDGEFTRIRSLRR